MTLPVVSIPEAHEDLLEARAWYDNIRTELGERFALAVEATVEAIVERPMQFNVVYRSRRRAGLRRFPYGIFFEVQERRIVVTRQLLLRRLGQYLLEESLLGRGLPQCGVAIHVRR